MSKANLFPCVIASLVFSACLNEGKTGTNESRSSSPASSPLGATPAREHPGPPLHIPQPDKGSATAVGREATPDASFSPTGRGGLTGMVESVNERHLRLRDQSGKRHELKMSASTRIMHNREPADRKLLKTGAEVLVSYQKEGDDQVVQQVDLLQKPATRKQVKVFNEKNP